MGKSKAVDLGHLTFTTQQEATKHFQDMLNRYHPGDKVSTKDAEDLSELLKRHPEYNKKISGGLNHFEVLAADYGTKCFNIIAFNGCPESFSFRTCITGRVRKDTPE